MLEIALLAWLALFARLLGLALLAALVAIGLLALLTALIAIGLLALLTATGLSHAALLPALSALLTGLTAALLLLTVAALLMALLGLLLGFVVHDCSSVAPEKKWPEYSPQRQPSIASDMPPYSCRERLTPVADAC